RRLRPWSFDGFGGFDGQRDPGVGLAHGGHLGGAASSAEKKCSWISVRPSSSTSIRPFTVSTLAISPKPPMYQPVCARLAARGTGKALSREKGRISCLEQSAPELRGW